jgi:pimeloyl-ACP methyl ester carboxylesterase
VPDQAGAFVETDCPFSIPDGTPARLVQCGLVTVPERHEEPDGPSIQIAVAVIKAKNLLPASDPLVMVEGGPGGSALSTLARVFALPHLSFLRRQRDLVIIEQRGTYHSQPVLDCPNAPSPGFGERPGSDVDLTVIHRECRETLLDAGVDLDAYNSLQNAADIPLVVAALGYGKYNFMGLSYGTMLAQHLMREHPDGLRSVVLDSAAPLERSFLPEVAASGDRAYHLLFDSCANDAFCRETYPDLESVFWRTVDVLDEEPLVTVLDGPDGTEPTTVLVDGGFLVSYLFESLYNAELIPYLPGYIYALSARDATWVEQHGYELLVEPTFSEGFFYTVLCAEDGDFASEETATRDVYPALQEAAVAEWDEFQTLCDVWDVAPLPDVVNQPVSADVPTLLLTGELDPITPPAFGRQVAETLSQSYVYTFPGASHGVIGAGACPLTMLADFLDDPTAPPDAACIADMAVHFDQPLAFYELTPVKVHGVRILVPAGWQEIEPGVFRPDAAPDAREIRLVTRSGHNPRRAARKYIQSLSPDGWRKYATETEGNREWHVYLAQYSTDLMIVSATVEGDTSYLHTLIAPESLVGDLADVIYFPAIREFKVEGN